jgi:hypothetical protein
VPVGVVGGGADADVVAAFALFRAAGFLTLWLEAALRSCDRRFRRAFFLTCALRRFIFIELRLSCFPTARKMRPEPTNRQARALVGVKKVEVPRATGRKNDRST